MLYHYSQTGMALSQSGISRNNIGPALRSERERQRIPLAQVANSTRISQRFLEAIEAGNFEALPGIVFARNFVRQYAIFLRIDADPLLAALPRFDIETAPLPNPPEKARKSGWDSFLTPAFTAAAWSVLAVGAAAGAWWYFERPKAAPLVATAGPANAQPTQTQTDLQPAQPGTTVISGTPESPGPAATQATQLAANAAPVDSGTAPAVYTPAAGTSGRSVQVVLTAMESSWVQVTADGRTAFTGILQRNDTRSVAADTAVKVTAGNAGGLQISLNGKTLDRIGDVGQVRTVRLTAEGPQFVPKTQSRVDPL